jgi:cell division protein ZapE
MVDAMVPPLRWQNQSFENFHPLTEYPSQLDAVRKLQALAERINSTPAIVAPLRLSRLRKGSQRTFSGDGGSVYLDGGFGVGKTHLLVALYGAVQGRKAYLSFSDLTAFVGAVGFASAREFLSQHRLVALDEFELDDPGDTVLVANLCRGLVDAGVRIAATSNTLPDRLGDGRFAADDFQREIGELRSSFEVIHLGGPDFRRRSFELIDLPGIDGPTVRSVVREQGGECLQFDEMNGLLSRIHPALYRSLLQGVRLLGMTGMHPYTDQYAALRFVSFVDRLYDLGVCVVVEGCALSDLYPPSFLSGGFRKKYGRSLSRLVTLCGEGRELIPAERA